MKIERFTENVYDEIRDKYSKLANSAKLLFEEIFDDKMSMGKISLNAYADTSDDIFYNLYCTIRALIKNETYNDFKMFLDVFVENNIEFTLEKNEFRANIIDIESFIRSLEIIKNTKKFNI